MEKGINALFAAVLSSIVAFSCILLTIQVNFPVASTQHDSFVTRAPRADALDSLQTFKSEPFSNEVGGCPCSRLIGIPLSRVLSPC